MKRVVLLRSNPVNPDPPVEKMANTLLRNGYEVTIVAWDRSTNESCVSTKVHFVDGVADITRFGIKATYGGGLKKTLPSLLKFQYMLLKWLIQNRRQYDIIHAFDFDTGFVASICTRMFRKKLVYHILDYYIASHDLVDHPLGKLVERAEIGVINRADATIICTEKRREQICKATPHNLFVIHNTPNDQIIDNECVTKMGDGDKASLVFVGTFGGERFLREAVSVIKNRNDVELHIAGFGELEKFVEAEAIANDNIYYYGRLSYEKTLALENQCDVMFAMYTPAIPNHRYAAPNKFYESLMLGKPIIMARDTGFDDIIISNGIGEIAEYNTESFNNALDRLLSNREHWLRIKKIARDMYEERFSWNIMEKRILDIYSEVGCAK